MALSGRDVVPTRSALLELREERRFTREGHGFLDQKRMLVAGELLRWLARYEEAHGRWMEAHAAARRALAEAVARHGLDALDVQPPAEVDLDRVTLRRENFMGVTLVHLEGRGEVIPASADRIDPSPESRRCARRYADLLALGHQVAVMEGNVRRLLDAYRRTERRARALENVVIPELTAEVKRIDEALEEQDHEEAARIRLRRHGR